MYGKLSVGWPYNRSTLEAISEQTLTSKTLTSNDIGSAQNSKEFKVRVYRKNIKDDNSEDRQELDLGKMIIENKESLLIIGGKGKSGNFEGSQYTFVLIKNILESPLIVVIILQEL